MTKLQEIKNKIYCLKHSTDSIEEAMEKELVLFGCRLTNGWCDYYVGEEERTYNITGDGMEISIDALKICGDFKILGTNISLADVLMAIGKKNVEPDSPYVDKDYYNQNSVRIILKRDGACLWNLEHDSLDWHAEHKPETINFIHSIICK